jgi:hypothetical protein
MIASDAIGTAMEPLSVIASGSGWRIYWGGLTFIFSVELNIDGLLPKTHSAHRK